jgi:general secretion pathway protein B
MSFILDALKKSEIERQRQTGPGMMDPATATPRARLPLWAAVLIALLLGINAIVLLVVLAHNGKTPVQDAQQRVEPSAAGVPGASSQPFSPLDAPPVYAPEIPVAGADADSRSVGRPAQNGAAVVASHAPRRPDPLLTDADARSEQEVLPTISEINLGTSALPDLHLDVHVFATKPADRFVYINMRKYHEGAHLEEGPTLERIRRDGVILNYNGLRFILPRQQ